MDKNIDNIIRNTSHKPKKIDSGFNKLISKHLMMNSVGVNSNKIDTNIMFYGDEFENNPAYRVVNHNGKGVGVHVIDEGVTNNLPKMNVIGKPPYRFQPGDIIEDTYGNWLCTAINESYGYNKGFFQSAHAMVKWIHDGKVETRPGIVTAKTLYTTGVKDEGTILVPNGMIGVLIPLDDITNTINRGVSFLFNSTKYTVTFKDTISVKGVLSMICEEVNVSELDDMENEIPDRWTEDGTDKLDEGAKPNQPIKSDDIKPDPEKHPEFKDFKIVGRDNLNFNRYSEYSVVGTAGNEFELTINNENIAFIREKYSDKFSVQTKYKGGVVTITAYIKNYPDIKTTKQILVTL